MVLWNLFNRLLICKQTELRIFDCQKSVTFVCLRSCFLTFYLFSPISWIKWTTRDAVIGMWVQQPPIAPISGSKSPLFHDISLIFSFQEPFSHHHHHHLLAPPLSHHMPLDQQLKRPLPVNGHNGHPKMPESPHGLSMPSPSMLLPPSSPSTSLSAAGSSTHGHPSSSSTSEQIPSPHVVEEYLQTQINRWRSNGMEMTDLISELLTVMPPEDQLQFMTGIMELMRKNWWRSRTRRRRNRCETTSWAGQLDRERVE